MYMYSIYVQMYLYVYLCHICVRFHLEVYFSLYFSNGVFEDKLKSQNMLTPDTHLIFS